MPTESCKVSAVIAANPREVFSAWLDSERHTAMTGGQAFVEPRLGGTFTAWDGYISGKTLEIEMGRRVVQSWRSAEFPAGASDSRIEVTFDPHVDGTLVTIAHARIPKGQGADYERGWLDHYLRPMKTHFARSAAPAHARTAKAKRVPAKPAPTRKAASRARATRKLAGGRRTRGR